jgi:subtilisin family serine protease
MNAIHLQASQVRLALLGAALLILQGGGAIAADLDFQGKVMNQGVLDRAAQGESVDVIVLLTGYRDYVGRVDADAPADMMAVQSEIASQQDDVLAQLDPSQFRVKHKFGNILGFSGRATEAGLMALAAMPEVELIYEDGIEHIVLKQGIPLMNASAVRSTYSGKEVAVAISDTGINYNHAMLGGGGFPNSKVIGGYDFGDNDGDPLDCQGHGTSVAGITSGTQASGPGDYIGGVAHDSKLYALKIVAGCSGSASTSDIAASWDWAVTHKNDDPSHPILVINTSFGGTGYTTACDASEPLYAAAANNAVANGIAVFAASGNDAYTNKIARPACVSNVISVGAVYDANVGYHGYSNCTDSSTAADKVTCYSNSASFLDLLAPSHDAYTTAVDGGYRTNFGGTSAASPYAAGAAAVLQDRAIAYGGALTVAALKSAMVDHGDPILDSRNGITKPRVNVGNAVGSSWDFCLQDTEYSTKLQFSLENGTIIRGLAYNAGSSFFPAPITGTVNYPTPGDLLMSVDYLNAAGLRIYTVAKTFAISDADSAIYDGPRAVNWTACSPVANELLGGGATGASGAEPDSRAPR